MIPKSDVLRLDEADHLIPVRLIATRTDLMLITLAALFLLTTRGEASVSTSFSPPDPMPRATARPLDSCAGRSEGT
jgi:hypothetical protein